MQATLRRMASSTGTTPAVSAFTAAANAAGITGHAANPTSFPTMPSALTFDLVARCGTTKARAATLKLPHGTVQTPLYMPVATQASLKGLTSEQLENVGCKLCLNNTYHLGLKPGQKVLDAVGGAHKLQGWNGNLLTDSGGFQMVSLLQLAKVTEEGVRFLSPHDGSPMLLTPEHSISLQNSIGSDIIMQLDDVIATTSPDDDRMREAMYRSIRWLDRCIAAHEKPETQNLFCIIQGGLDLQMRKECCEEMVKRNTPGIAIGGLSGGEEKAKYCEVVDTCTGLLPDNKPRYVMGVGYPEDLVVSVALGADMFDCVWATRTARFGNAITSRGVLNLRQAVFSTSLEPIDPDCTCPICLPALSPYPPTSHAYTASTSTTPVGLGISRAFIHHLAAKETAGAHLLTIHNVYYLLQLMADARQSIVEGRFERFLRAWFARWNGWNKERYSEWAVGALRGVGVDLLAEGEGDLEGKEGK
ncbi:queuine tRNA-ribosyltransferase [Peziza echinospora]|nr:queuine tRNA-ribosyltransferase [Peziza echinospora]